MEDIKTNESELHQENEGQETPQGKTYTQEELNELLQREGDRRVTSALAKQKKEYEKQISLSKLDENERAVAEKDNRISELEEQLKEFRTIQAKNEMVKVLDARGLSPQFADLIYIDDDIQASQSRIEALDNLFKKAVQDEVKKRLASPSPKLGITEDSGELNKEKFKKMNLKQRQELFTSNPDLYNKLAGC